MPSLSPGSPEVVNGVQGKVRCDPLRPGDRGGLQNALAFPQWWDWAVGTGMDLRDLVRRATDAQLIGPNDLSWQGRASTRRAMARGGGSRSAL
jgi:hypothetical protein